MLVEIHVRDSGVIEDLDLLLGPGMTALTGETGAGKTLVVEALELLVGGRADTALVRSGAEAAVVEGRFVTSPAEAAPGPDGEDEIVVRQESLRTAVRGLTSTAAWRPWRHSKRSGRASSIFTASTLISPSCMHRLSGTHSTTSAA